MPFCKDTTTVSGAGERRQHVDGGLGVLRLDGEEGEPERSLQNGGQVGAARTPEPSR